MVERCNRTILSLLRTVLSEQQNDWDDHLPATLCAYRSTPHASTGINQHKMVYGIEMTLPLDLMLGDTGPEQAAKECPYEYVEWISDSLRQVHECVRRMLKTSAKHQRHSYGALNRVVQFHRGEWVWRAYPRQGGKLRYTNRGPWLVLAKTGPVTDKIQRHPQAEPDIMHVDKLMPYYPDFGEELHSWIETDYPTRYRDQGDQTTSPNLQSQLTAVVDIPPRLPGDNPDPGPMTLPPDPLNPPLEPENPIETNTTKSAETENLPVVLETQLDSTAQADPEPCNGPSVTLEPEATPAACPDTAPKPLPADQVEPETPDDSPEVTVTSQNRHPDLGLIETLVGSQSTVPLPHRGTRPRKQPERYVPVHRLQVLPVDQAQTGPSVWLFPTIRVAVTLSAALPDAPLTL